MKMYFRLFAVVCLSMLFADTSNGQGATPNPDLDGPILTDFTEDFENGVANFLDADRNFAQLLSTGGVNDSAFIRGVSSPDFQNVILRAERDARAPGTASGGAFAGNYLASQVETLSFYLRHDSATDVDLGLRFALPGNFPGIAVDLGPVVSSSIFQEFTVDFTDSTIFAAIEGAPFAAVAADIGNIQILADSADTNSFNVDIDNFSVVVASASVPEPTSMMLFGTFAGLASLRRRRR